MNPERSRNADPPPIPLRRKGKPAKGRRQVHNSAQDNLDGRDPRENVAREVDKLKVLGTTLYLLVRTGMGPIQPRRGASYYLFGCLFCVTCTRCAQQYTPYIHIYRKMSYSGAESKFWVGGGR